MVSGIEFILIKFLVFVVNEFGVIWWLLISVNVVEGFILWRLVVDWFVGVEVDVLLFLDVEKVFDLFLNIDKFFNNLWMVFVFECLIVFWLSMVSGMVFFRLIFLICDFVIFICLIFFDCWLFWVYIVWIGYSIVLIVIVIDNWWNILIYFCFILICKNV